METKTNKTDYDKLFADRLEYILPGTFWYYQNPLHLVRGEMQYVFDSSGKQYLDAFSGVVTVSVGHCHPDVVEPVRKQLGTLQHVSSLYLTEPMVRLAKKMAEVMPGNLKVTFLTNSGTEANELAGIITKNYTGRHEFIALRHSFHGRTLLSMSMTGQSIWRHSTPYVYGVNHAPSAYCYRCPHGKSYPGCDISCADDVEEIIKYSTTGKVAAFIAEPIQGFGGVIDPPPEYFPKVYEIVKKYDGLFISDEVQTGFGRTGGKWWGIEKWGVMPDMITMAKGMGNGMPLGAVTTTKEIASCMEKVTHFSTFGGNPVCSTQGAAVIDTIKKYDYVSNAAEVGKSLKAGLQKLAEEHDIIGEVRGKGLMLGVELVKDRDSKEPASKELLEVQKLCEERGLLVGKGAQAGNVIRIKPPLCITSDDASFILEVLDESLRALS
jgi:4-aminobutyrate aminotransferase-like enzyme